VNTRVVTDRAEWNSALAALPAQHVLQSWEWGQFKSRWGWSPKYLLLEQGGRPCAAALILRRALPRIGLSILYIPKGPALDYTDAPLVDAVLAEIESFARRERALFVKIDPDVPHPLSPSPESKQHDSGEGGRVVAELTRRGWRFSSEQIQFRNTILLDVTPPEEDLLAAMKPKTRYNIRLAGKKGVSVRVGGSEDIERLYAMYVETARRDGFILRPPEYYRDVWGSFTSAGLAQPLIAEVDGEAVGGLVLFRFGSRAWYMYGMSRDAHRDKMPNHLLQWEAIRWVKSHGCTVYDGWGAPDELSESDPMWGVYRFKEGFGGKFAAHIGAYDFAASKLWYWVYSAITPRVLEVMRRRGRRNLGL
jgi:lipid II:glycine glycyltransferase (peptidoglycan interpeptide bridge formation enzyme)